MDIWQIVNLCLPFLEVVIHTIIHSLKEKSKNKVTPIQLTSSTSLQTKKVTLVKQFHDDDSKISTLEKIDYGLWITMRSIAMYGIPIIYVLFLITFFSVGLALQQ